MSSKKDNLNKLKIKCWIKIDWQYKDNISQRSQYQYYAEAEFKVKYSMDQRGWSYFYKGYNGK